MSSLIDLVVNFIYKLNSSPYNSTYYDNFHCIFFSFQLILDLVFDFLLPYTTRIIIGLVYVNVNPGHASVIREYVSLK